MRHYMYAVEQKVEPPRGNRSWFVVLPIHIYERKSEAWAIRDMLREENPEINYRVSEVAPYDRIHLVDGGSFVLKQ